MKAWDPTHVNTGTESPSPLAESNEPEVKLTQWLRESQLVFYDKLQKSSSFPF